MRRVVCTLAVCAGLVAGAIWVFFNGLPLPVTAADRAALLTARDLEPWIPGFAADAGEESTKKRMNFFLSRGIDTQYVYENLKAPSVGLLCNVREEPTEQDAADSFESLVAATRFSSRLLGFGRLLDSRIPLPSLTEQEDILRWGDSSRFIFMSLGSSKSTTFVARKGKRVFALLLVGPRIEDDGLRRVLLPRLEAISRG